MMSTSMSKKKVARATKEVEDDFAFSDEAPVADDANMEAFAPALAPKQRASRRAMERKAVVSKSARVSSQDGRSSEDSEENLKAQKISKPLPMAESAMKASAPSKSAVPSSAMRTNAPIIQQGGKAGPPPSKASDLSVRGKGEMQRSSLKAPQQQQQQLLPSNRFQVIRSEKLGSGGFGTVYKGFDTLNGSHVAVKETSLSADASVIDSLQQEFALLTTLDHPNIVKVFDYKLDDREGKAQIIMEWMASGSVKSIIDQSKFRLHENVIRRYLRAGLEGLAYLHDRNLLHRDVKPANMLLGGDTVKLSDFGTSKLTQNQSATTTQHVVGTSAYMAPESIARGKYSPASDMWAVGCSAVEMATGLPPWFELPEERRAPIPLMFHIGTAQPPNHHPSIPEHLSVELKEIVRSCFEYEPAQRAVARELLKREYFTRPALPVDAETLQQYQQRLKDHIAKRQQPAPSASDLSQGLSQNQSSTEEGSPRTDTNATSAIPDYYGASSDTGTGRTFRTEGSYSSQNAAVSYSQPIMQQQQQQSSAPQQFSVPAPTAQSNVASKKKSKK